MPYLGFDFILGSNSSPDLIATVFDEPTCTRAIGTSSTIFEGLSLFFGSGLSVSDVLVTYCEAISSRELYLVRTAV